MSRLQYPERSQAVAALLRLSQGTPQYASLTQLLARRRQLEHAALDTRETSYQLNQRVARLIKPGGGLVVINPGRRRPQESWESLAQDVLARYVAPQERHPSKSPELPHEPAALSKALADFGMRGFNLTRIESRPVRGKPFHYQFFLDFECATLAEADVAIAALRLTLSRFMIALHASMNSATEAGAFLWNGTGASNF